MTERNKISIKLKYIAWHKKKGDFPQGSQAKVMPTKTMNFYWSLLVFFLF